MDEHQQMVEDCEHRQNRLSEWECEFIESISARLGNGKSLTDNQAEQLEMIWERATKNG